MKIDMGDNAHEMIVPWKNDDLREKVIRGLEEFKADLKPFAGNEADWQKVDNALDLLKAQEPRILDYEELKKEAGKIAVWPEITMGDGHKELFAPCTPIFMIDKPETIGLKSTGNILFMDEHAYKTEGGFVCWSSRPTDEQREAVKWDE